MSLCESLHDIGQQQHNLSIQCWLPASPPEVRVWSCRHVYSLQSCRNRAMASSGERARSHGPQRKRFKSIPLAVTRWACPCGQPGEMIAVEVPPDLPMVPCRCTGCGPTAYVGCATRIAPYMEVCGPCRPFWNSRARVGATQPSTEVTAQVNVVSTPGANSQLQASCALHCVIVCGFK